ncbi:MAG: ANTAR domain-containing protein [Blautia sp.]|nr:ANTAR domain-containing protein [Blautia sp.]
MGSIVVAFSKKEAAASIRRILAQSGYRVQAVCTTGGQALSSIGELDGGILICGARFIDMMYTELYECLPNGFQMLLIAPADDIRERQVENLVCLSMPLKVHELLHTVEMMEGEISRRKKRMHSLPAKRSKEEQALIGRAKSLLMERNGLTEAEAHSYIQRRSMESGTGLVEVSQMILSLWGDG